VVCCRVSSRVASSGLGPVVTRSLFQSYLGSIPDCLGTSVFGSRFAIRSNVGLHSRGSGRVLAAAMASNSAPEDASGKTWVDVVKTDVEVSDVDENLDATHGFTRQEMIKKKPLVGSVDLYERHVFLRYNQPSSWPSKVEAPGYDPLPSKFVNAMRSKKNELAKKVSTCLAPPLLI
jgi:hypothetical protein